MAIGNGIIMTARGTVNDLTRCCKGGNGSVHDCWNTFNYVYNNLQAWASDTTIGTELRKNIQNLNNGIYDLNNQTLKLLKSVEQYLDKQQRLNNTR